MCDLFDNRTNEQLTADGRTTTTASFCDRIGQTFDGTPTQYLLNLNRALPEVIGEFEPGDDTWYLLGMDIVAQQQGTDWGYFGFDGLGSLRQVTNSLGVPVYQASYSPYGQPFAQGGSASAMLAFTGEMTDANGALYLRARYYHPALGTFLTRDPVEGVMQRIMSRNGYSYVEGNVVNYTDPSGKIALVDDLLILLLPDR